MIDFVKGIFHDQLTRVSKMLDDLQSPEISKEVDGDFLKKTVQMLTDLGNEIMNLIDSEL